MKILLLFFLFIFGCKEHNILDEFQSAIYTLDEVYVEIEKEKVHQLFDICESDYVDYLALKTLIVYDQKEIFVFYKPSYNLINKLVNKENYMLLEMDSYVYYGVDDLEIITRIKDILNK